MAVEIVKAIPPVDRENLKGYWAGVQGKTGSGGCARRRPKSRGRFGPGEDHRLDSHGWPGDRYGGGARSGNAALDRAAMGAITGAAPYESFPYGIAVDQVKVRFTFRTGTGAGGSRATPID